MYREKAILYLQNITPLHAGAGDQIGIVDLPIQRESHTHYPKIESSSLKGALRQRFERGMTGNHDLVKINLTFGFDETGIGSSLKQEFSDMPGKYSRFFQGALAFSDARLLLFPVKSMRGVMAWGTCPYALKRFLRDLDITQHTIDPEISTAVSGLATGNLAPSDHTGYCYAKESAPIVLSKNSHLHVILEEYAFTVKRYNHLDKLADYLQGQTGINDLGNHLVILHDDDFEDFVRMSTEINTRIKIDDKTGTVATGQLFTEEFLPSEAVLYSLIGASPVFQQHNNHQLSSAAEVMQFFKQGLTTVKSVFQLGGNTSLGKGLIHAKIQ